MLYVALQHSLSLTQLPRQIASSGIHQWIYLGEDSPWRIQAESIIHSAIPRVSIAEPLDEMSWRLRQPYIDWIGDLSQRNHSLEWWASQLAAKNAYSKLHLRVCLLAVARQLIDSGFKDPMLVICATPALSAEVLHMADTSGVTCHQLIGRSRAPSIADVAAFSSRYLSKTLRSAHSFGSRLVRGLGNPSASQHSDRQQILRDKGLTPRGEFAGADTILLFTWVDRRSFSADGKYCDPYFGPLPQMLKDLGYRVAYVPRVIPTIPFHEAVDRLLGTDETLFFPELFVSDEEQNICNQRAQQFSPVIPPESTVGGVPVCRLALEHVDETRGSLAEALAYQPLVANLSASGVRPREIIYTCEGHTWEHVLTWSVRQHMPGTTAVGYDNLTLSRLMLSMFPATNEYGLRPLPDRIVTNGPFYRDILVAEGLPHQLVQSGCGLRHTYLWADTGRPKVTSGAGGPSRPTCILVATAIEFGESVELVAKAALAFGGNPGYQLLIRCHPLVKAEQVVRQLGDLVRYDNIQFVTAPVKELLPTTHILLYTHTIVCYEALQHGVIPICVRLESFLNLDKLEGTPDVRWVATTPEDLRRVAEQVMGMSDEERRRWQKRASEVVRAALAPVTPEGINAFLV